MNKKIEKIALEYLDFGAVDETCQISEVYKHFKISIVKWIGSLLISEGQDLYFVIYESLMPLHGGEITHIITSVIPTNY